MCWEACQQQQLQKMKQVQQKSLAMLSLHMILNFFCLCGLDRIDNNFAVVAVHFVVNIIATVVVVLATRHQLHKLVVGIPKTTRLNKLLAAESIYAFLLST